MSFKTTAVTFSILSALPLSVFAAQSINAQQARNLQPVGIISVSGIAGSPVEIRQALSDKADAKGAQSFRVIEARQEGNFHATAEIYQ